MNSKKVKGRGKRFIASFLAMLMVVTMLPVNALSVAYAEELDAIETEAPENTVAVDEETAAVDNVAAADEETETDDSVAATDEEADEPQVNDGESSEDAESEEGLIIDAVEPVAVIEEAVASAAEEEVLAPAEVSAAADTTGYTELSSSPTTWEFTTANWSGWSVTSNRSLTTDDDLSGIKVNSESVSEKVKSKCADGQISIDVGGIIDIPVSTDTDAIVIEVTLSGTGGNNDERGLIIGTGTSKDTVYHKGSTSGNHYFSGDPKSYTNGTLYTKEDSVFSDALSITGIGGETKITKIVLHEYTEVVDPVALTGATVTLTTGTSKATTATYTGKPIAIDVTVTASGETVKPKAYTTKYYREGETEGRFDVETIDLTSVGKIKAVVTSIHENEGDRSDATSEAAFEITPATLEVDDKEVSIAATQVSDYASDELDLAELIKPLSESDTFKYTLDNSHSDYAAGTVVTGTPVINGSKLTYGVDSSATSANTATVLVVKVESANYNDAYIKITVAVEDKTPVTVVGTSATHIYDGAAYGFEDKATFKLIGDNNSEITDTDAIADIKKYISYTFTKVVDGTASAPSEASEPVNAGIYKVTATLSGNSDYTMTKYKGEDDNDVTLTINPKPLTLKANNRIWVKGYTNTPETTAKNTTLYYNYDELDTKDGEGNATNTSITKLIDAGAKVNLAYQVGGVAVNDWTAVEAGEIDIIPSMTVETSSSTDANAVDVLSNYAITSVNAKLTVMAEETALDDNVYDLNFTKDWVDNSGLKYKDGNTTDGKFTVVADAKTAGTNNKYPLIVYDKYTAAAKLNSGKSIKFSTTKDNSKVEVIAHVPAGQTLKVGSATIAVSAAGAVTKTPTTLAVTVDDSATGTVILPTKTGTEYNKILKIEVPLATAGQCTIERGDSSSEPFVYYVKVTEASSSDVEVTVNVTDPESKLPADAKIVFTPASGDPVKAAVGAKASLTPTTPYTLSLEDASGAEITTLTAKVNGSTTYTPAAGAESVTVTIETKSEGGGEGEGDQPGPVSVVVSLDSATASKLPDGAKIVFTPTTGSAVTVGVGETANLMSGTAYNLSLVDSGNTAINTLVAKVNGSTTYTPAKDANAVTIVIEDASTNPPANKPAAPTFSPASSQIAQGGKVTLTAATGATIYYTTATGSDTPADPTEASTQYDTNGIVLNTLGTNTIKAIAVKDGQVSDVATKTYNVVDASEIKTGLYVELDPELTPAGGYVYTGGLITPAIIVTNNGEELTEGVDYTVKYTNNKNANNTKPANKQAKITVTGKGSFTGKATTTFTINPKDLNDEDVVAGNITVVKKKKVAPVLVYKGIKLANKDFTFASDSATKFDAVPDENSTEPTQVKVDGKGNFTGTRTIPVKVVESNSDLKKITVKVVTKSFVYDGTAHEAEIEVKSGSETVTNTTDLEDKYAVTYNTSNVNAGTVKFTVIGMGDYTGSVTKTYKITPAKTASVTAALAGGDNASYTYVSTGVTVPDKDISVTVAGDNNTSEELVKDVDYKVSYSGNKKVSKGNAKAKCNITFIGNYKGCRKQSLAFTITPATISDDTVKVYAADKVFKNPGLYKSVPTVIANDGTLLKKSDYTVAYYLKGENDAESEMKGSNKVTAAGTKVYIKVTGKGNYAATSSDDSTAAPCATGEYTVCALGEGMKDISKAKIELYKKGETADSVGDKVTKIEYTGEEITFNEEDSDYVLKLNLGSAKSPDYVDAANFDIAYANNTNKGKATIVITPSEAGSTQYVGGKTATFSIVAQKVKTDLLGSLFGDTTSGGTAEFIKSLFN